VIAVDEQPDAEVFEPSIESIRQVKQQLSKACWQARRRHRHAPGPPRRPWPRRQPL